MAPMRSAPLTLAALCLLCGASLRVAFLGTGRVAAAPRVARSAFDSGKVNVGVELESDVPPPPQPVLECDEGCIAAINDCIEEGCSVDAIMKLDKKLAEDEQKVQATMASIEGQQKTGYTEENTGSLAWLKNFLGRSGSLRAQLQALKTIEDGDFIKQMVKAASVAFGGGRTGDYPKVGVSPYSS